MYRFAITLVAVPALIFSTSAQAQISFQPATPADAKAQVFTLEAKDGVTCANGTLAWPAALTFPAGLMAQRPAPPVSSGNDEPIVFNGSDPQPALQAKSPRGYTLSFDVLTNGRMTNIRPLATDYPMYNNDFLPAWAAGWTLGAQEKPLTGCKMTWTVKTDYSPEAARPLMYEAGQLRNITPGLQVTDPRTPDCKAADRRIKTRAYPDVRASRKTPARPQWVVVRYDVLANGKVKPGGQVRASGDAENLSAIEKALGQRTFHAGEPAAECLTSLAISPATLPVEPGIGELSALNKAPIKGDGDTDEQKTCPADMRREAMTFTYRADYYPAQAKRLGVEGVALLTFDVAPWGQVRLKSSWSHPLPQFGQAATRMLNQSTFKASDRGLSGCRLLVRFVREKDEVETNEADEEDAAS